MLAENQTSDNFKVLLTHLHESHELSVYQAIERLVQASEAIGLGAPDLLRMLDRGMTLEELLEYIEVQMERLQEAPAINTTAA